MVSDQLSEVLTNLSLDASALDDVTVLVLPENVAIADAADFKDAQDSILLAKHFKAEGLRCKTAFDLGCKPKVLERHGADVWLGVIWLVEHLAAPTAVGVLSAWLCSRYGNSDTTRIHVELKLEDDHSTSTLKYDGSLPEFQKVLEGIGAREPKQIEE